MRPHRARLIGPQEKEESTEIAVPRQPSDDDVKFHALLESAPDAIVVTGGDGRIRVVNAETERLFGYRREELLGQVVEVLLPVGLRAVHANHRDRYREAPHRRPMGAGLDLVARRKDGTEFPAEISLSPFQSDDGLWVIAIVRDITERRRAEQERERLALEQAARREAEQVSRFKDEFLATLSHELRTPLNAILGWARLLLEKRVDVSRMQHGLEVIARNAEAQARLVSDLLDISRIITGKLQLQTESVDLRAVTTAAIESVMPAAAAKGVEIHSSFPPQAAIVAADPDRLQQVLWNLLSNAVKFTPGGGRVELSISQADASFEVRVRDTGDGIPPEFLSHVFDRFRQWDSSLARTHGGLGLGLAIVRHLVEHQGGTVRAESAGPGKGASFIVQLPVPRDRLQQRTAGSQRHLERRSAGSDGHTNRWRTNPWGGRRSGCAGAPRGRAGQSGRRRGHRRVIGTSARGRWSVITSISSLRTSGWPWRTATL